MTNAAVRLFQLFSTGDLEMKEELEIRAKMTSKLSWNNARIILESEFEKSYTGATSDFTQHKAKYITDGRIKRYYQYSGETLRKNGQFLTSFLILQFAALRYNIELLNILRLFISKIIFCSYLCRTTTCGMKTTT